MIACLVIGIVVALLGAVALSDDVQRERRPSGPYGPLAVKDLAVLYSGALVCTDANGEAVPADDAAGLTFRGVSYGPRVDNRDDGEEVFVDKSQWFKIAGSGLTIGDVGRSLYAIDDSTAGLADQVTHHVYIGKLAAFISAAEAWCDPTQLDNEMTTDAPAEIADPAAATSTDGAIAAVTLTEAITPQVADGAAAALTFTAGGATGPEVEALRDITEDHSEDIIALNAAVATIRTELLTALAEIEKIGDDARAALAAAAATITAMKDTLGIAVDPS